MPLHVSSTCAHHQEVKIALHSLWYRHTYSWSSRALIVKQKFCASSWLITEINKIRQYVYNLLFKQEVAAAPVISMFSFLSHSSMRPLLELYYTLH